MDDQYPWTETLFFHKYLADRTVEMYNQCKAFIEVHYVKKISTENARWIGDQTYIGDNLYIDLAYGAKIERTDEKRISLTVSQECNEWLVILLEISLLLCGYTMIHGAGVEKDGKVYLMPSWGGVGKTATVCEFVRNHDWRLLGDDLIIIDDTSAASFLKPFVIYPYHRKLFPEVFQSGKSHTVKNIAVSNLMSKMIPTVKRILRPFPGVLAYIRKHNPQSVRISPYDLFSAVQLSAGGIPQKTVWLERTRKENLILTDAEVQIIVSKAVSVTSCEIFASKLNDVYQMCGCGLFRYDEIFSQMNHIMFENFRKTQCCILEIPVTVNINDIGKIIYDVLQKDDCSVCPH
ncbi:MAG: hypothetical protein IJ449_01430 [Clostridia bacterium]|nr:hypothetical protein [Clostridia bacterium]